MPVPGPSRLAVVSSLRSRIFQTLPPPPSPSSSSSSSFPSDSPPPPLRTGLRYLTRPLQAPLKANYYPPARPVNFKKLNKFLVGMAKEEGFEGDMLEYWNLPDLREEQRLAKLDYDKKRGKGPPKKGEGRRSTMKKKR